MTDEEILKKYIEERAKAGFPEVSEAEAKKESDALDSFGNYAFKKYTKYSSIPYPPSSMDDEYLRSYQKVRADNGYPEISDAEALIEANALLNFMMATYRPGWNDDSEAKS